MKIALIQTEIVWGSPEANIAVMDTLIDHAGKADLYVLPEMFSTGFVMQPENYAEKQGLSLKWMQGKARQTDAAVCGSLAVADGDKYYNRFYFVKPDGSVAVYNKRHLFTYSGEHEHYQKGNGRTVVEWRGVRILLQVCYDLRFPVFSRNHKDYDLALYVASWPESRRMVWDILLKARAIENQCYVAGVNRVGDDQKCHYNGGTAIISPYGNVVSDAADNETYVVVATLDMEKLKAFREKFPVLDDAD
jgi:predicted amidohydrolase